MTISFEKINETSAFWNDKNECYDVNMSSIYSFLIQEAGRWIERYSSDILYGFKNINEFLSENGAFEYTEYFGMRENGCDHFSYIKNNLIDNKYQSTYYRKIYAVQMKTILCEYGEKLEITLNKVNIYSY